MKASLSRRFLLVFGILTFLTAACALPVFPGQPDQVGVQTQAVRTIDAKMTEISANSITATPNATDQGAPAATAAAAATAAPATQVAPTVSQPTLLPSSTPLPTATTVIIPTATATPICDAYHFVGDITIKDGTQIPMGMRFDKTWRLRNTGACTWTSDYSVVFDSGASMGGPASQKITASVLPGATVDISVPLYAPNQKGSDKGHYRGYWRMRNAAGVLFGDKFYVDINVIDAPTSTAGYDFASNQCFAQWTGNDKAIPCLGMDGSVDGFVLYVANPQLETGYIDNEAGLITNPPQATDSVIRGKFPVYAVKAKDHFASIIGCEYNAKNCSVRFQLDYQIDNGTIQTFAAWNEAYDNHFTNVDIDLSSLAGKNVQFILTVLANGASNQDRALWLKPRIVNQP